MYKVQGWKKASLIQDQTCKAFAGASATRSYFYLAIGKMVDRIAVRMGTVVTTAACSPLGAEQRGNMVLTAVLGIKSQPPKINLPLTLGPGFTTMAISSFRC